MPDEMLVRLNQAATEGLALVDRVLVDYYNFPSIYEVAPKYRIGPRESWKDIGAILKDGWGDCKDFTAWRLAELWKLGINAKAECIVQRQGRRLLFHVYVRHPDGSIEDPAKLLGMP